MRPSILLALAVLAAPALAEPRRPARIAPRWAQATVQAPAQAPAQSQARPPAPPAQSLAAPGRPGWTVDRRSGCWLFNPNPMPGAAARWHGPCPHGPADGQGTAEWRWSEAGRNRLDRYVGTLVQGRIAGEGAATHANGDFYQGGWQDWRKHGQGIAIWANGDRYIGQWQAGRRHGRGTMLWANGNQYDGEWRDDVADGEGEFAAGAAHVFSGIWHGGCLRDRGWVVAVNRPMEECGAERMAGLAPAP